MSVCVSNRPVQPLSLRGTSSERQLHVMGRGDSPQPGAPRGALPQPQPSGTGRCGTAPRRGPVALRGRAPSVRSGGGVRCAPPGARPGVGCPRRVCLSPASLGRGGRFGVGCLTPSAYRSGAFLLPSIQRCRIGVRRSPDVCFSAHPIPHAVCCRRAMEVYEIHSRSPSRRSLFPC